jgi:hypothetical protein
MLNRIKKPAAISDKREILSPGKLLEEHYLRIRENFHLIYNICPTGSDYK